MDGCGSEFARREQSQTREHRRAAEKGQHGHVGDERAAKGARGDIPQNQVINVACRSFGVVDALIIIDGKLQAMR